MELILKKPINELIPAMIAFNNEELMQEAKRSLAKYKSKIYDDNSIGEAKADRAKLNSICKQLNAARLDIKKQYEAPYLKFKGQIDEVISTVDSVTSTIDAQIKDFEAQRQADKQDAIIAYFKANIGDLEPFVKYEQIHNSKWLNVSVSIKSIEQEILEKIEQIRNELLTIEALKSSEDATLKAFYFRTLNLSAALLESERLKVQQQRIAEAKAEAEAKAKEQQQLPKQEPAEPIASAKIEPQATYTIKFAVTATQAQLQALKSFLQEQKIEYQAIQGGN